MQKSHVYEPLAAYFVIFVDFGFRLLASDLVLLFQSPAFSTQQQCLRESDSMEKATYVNQKVKATKLHSFLWNANLSTPPIEYQVS